MTSPIDADEVRTMGRLTTSVLVDAVRRREGPTVSTAWPRSEPPANLEQLTSAVRESLLRRAARPHDILVARGLFYRRHGGSLGGGHGYGRSELDFLGWMLRRGPLGGRGRHASPWWSGVNFDVAFHSEVAAAVLENGLSGLLDVPAPVSAWLTYLRAPSALTWYRAHNASVVRSYLARAHQARAEPFIERGFLRRVLVRLLSIQAIHEHSDLLPWLSRHADPRGGLVARVLRQRWLYPSEYPVRPTSLEGGGQVALGMLEAWIWKRGLDALFRAASIWLELPEMTGLLRDGRLCYPDEPEAASPVLWRGVRA